MRKSCAAERRADEAPGHGEPLLRKVGFAVEPGGGLVEEDDPAEAEFLHPEHRGVDRVLSVGGGVGGVQKIKRYRPEAVQFASGIHSISLSMPRVSKAATDNLSAPAGLSTRSARENLVFFRPALVCRTPERPHSSQSPALMEHFDGQ